jgi:hypothetical protein
MLPLKVEWFVFESVAASQENRVCLHLPGAVSFKERGVKHRESLTFVKYLLRAKQKVLLYVRLDSIYKINLLHK